MQQERTDQDDDDHLVEGGSGFPDLLGAEGVFGGVGEGEDERRGKQAHLDSLGMRWLGGASERRKCDLESWITGSNVGAGAWKAGGAGGGLERRRPGRRARGRWRNRRPAMRNGTWVTSYAAGRAWSA